MTECFGTEDELEASDDNTLEDSKDIKESKKKRRKRSSSLQGMDAAFFSHFLGGGGGGIVERTFSSWSFFAWLNMSLNTGPFMIHWQYRH